MERSGILCAGCWLVDNGKVVARWPREETLASIVETQIDGGGPAHNVAVDLKRLGAVFPIWGMGAVGNDEAGRFLLRSCSEYGIDTERIRVFDGICTSQTDVITVLATGKRTFFHLQGANALLQSGDFDFSGIAPRILHLGAPGIHRGLDEVDGEFANGWVAILTGARRHGIKTNLELVSSTPEEIRRLGNPCLPLLDTLIVNDYEADALTGLRIVENGRASFPTAETAALALLDRGVREAVVVHFPEGCVAAARGGRTFIQPSLAVPQDAIGGANGAGDAFAAGVLYGLHEAWPLGDCLALGHCTAASALRSASATASVLSAAECLALSTQWGWRICS